MAKITFASETPIYDGMPLTIKAPCDCTAVDGLRVYHSIVTDEKETSDQTDFVFVDAHGNTLTGLGNLFMEGAYIRVILDTTENKAYIQNADTNAYLEAQLANTAKAGFGYGEPMVWLGFDATTWSSTGTFQSDLEAVFSTLPQGGCMQVQFIDTELSSQKFTGTLWKYTAAYGFLTATNYSGVKAIKTLYNNTWQPWEWENPPMVAGTEYRTTERYDGKPVYAKTISCSGFNTELNGSKSFALTDSVTNVVGVSSFSKLSNGLVFECGTLTWWVDGVSNDGGSWFVVITHNNYNMSNRTVLVTVKYTKD